MVTTLNITLDDDVAKAARDVKNERGLTWPEFIEVASDELAEEPERTPPTPIENGPINEESREIERFEVELELPGSGEQLERRKETIREMAALLEERGTATKSDFLELVDPDEVGYASRESFWANCVKGRESLKAIPGVETPSTGQTAWTFEDR